MLRTLSLRFGVSLNDRKLNIKLSPITIFVGPNNSGKSLVLREIHAYCINSFDTRNNKILDELTFSTPNIGVFQEDLHLLEVEPNPNEYVSPENAIFGKYNPNGGFHRIQVNRNLLLQAAHDPNNNKPLYTQCYVRFYTVRLDGQNRITLINQQPAGDLQEAPQNHLAVLFRDDIKRLEVRRIIKEAFDKFFVIDPTNIGNFRIKLSSRAPIDIHEERGLDDGAIKFHSEALDIMSTSDGVKAFTGIVTTLVAGEPRIILLDEPEAFLHPSLAYKLGKEVAKTAQREKQFLFSATHSANFLMGCVQSGTPVNIIRLTYTNGMPTARLLPQYKVVELMRRPLLRSTGILDALFYEYVVVTEGDVDRAFYQEINERLLAFRPEKGIPHCLFINARNKQTVWEIIKPLRDLGVPAVGVVDIDILKEGGKVWLNALEAALIPQANYEPLQIFRDRIHKKLVATGKDMKVDGGIEVLEDDNDKEACANLLHQLSEYGIFVVPNGELESWLRYLGVRGHGPQWLVDIFEKMGENPEIPSYVKPTDDDIWDFIYSIKVWLTNPNRKGIPK
jgi:ABC-type uncharacterized transport system YnjBCD ATPase subunit